MALWLRFSGHVSSICFGIGAYKKQMQETLREKRGQKNVARGGILELNLTRLAEELSLLA